MHETGIKLLNLMFRPKETICVSPNKYAYCSVFLESATSKPTLKLLPSNAERDCESVDTDSLLLVALNPIQGVRSDVNCTAFRNFLVEMDTGTTDEQLEYAKRIGLPYSAIVFSGNKSLHFLVSLSEDLPNETIYRKFSEWILAVATAADPDTKNPSRSIRIPGAFREEGKQQQLVEIKDPISVKTLVTWLANYPHCMPKEREKREISEEADIEKVSRWAKGLLENGLDPTKGRNKQWYAIAYDFALSGFSEDATLDILSQYFVSERDFTEREWRTTVNSAFKHAHSRRY